MRFFCHILLLLLSATTACAENNPFQPTVTTREAGILQRAAELLPDDVNAAIALLDEERNDKGSAALDFAAGNFYYQDNRMEEAAAAYGDAIGKLPLFRAALNNLGRVYMQEKDLERAAETFQALARSGQADGDTLVLLGHALLLQGHPVSAEGAYRQALVLNIHAPNAMRGLAKCLIEQQRTAEALALTQELLRVDPADGEVWTLRANAFLLLDRTEDAITSIETCSRLDLATPSLLATLGDLYINRRQPREATAAYKKAFEQDEPSLDRILRAAEGFLLLDDPTAARSLLEQAHAQKKPGTAAPAHHAGLLRLEARLAMLQGDPRTARRQYEELLRHAPLDGEALLALANLARNDGDAGMAELLCERASRIDGHEAQALLQHAELKVDGEDYAAAAGLLESSLAFDNRPAIARYLEQVRRLVPQDTAETGRPPARDREAGPAHE